MYYRLCEVGYEGPLCAVCEEGYAAVGSGADLVCNEFTGSATQTIAIGFSIIGAVIAVVVFWCCRSARGKGSIEERAPRASDSLERQSSRARGISESAREKYDAVTSFIDSAQPYFKILLAYFQVAGGLSFAFQLRFPPMFTNFMKICKNVLSLDVISLMPLGCLTLLANAMLRNAWWRFRNTELRHFRTSTVGPDDPSPLLQCPPYSKSPVPLSFSLPQFEVQFLVKNLNQDFRF